MRDAHARVITRLRELGAQVHLDDFGTGYSSLAQLARIPLDAIKLDKSFVRGVNFNPVSQSLVRAIVAAAEALKFRVIAEGVETESENRFLDEVGRETGVPVCAANAPGTAGTLAAVLLPVTTLSVMRAGLH
ncbi:EAL domain-containing protein [Serratia plymuthica]|uniref:EAL domain-containing protein n=1 Tax=Serratia plymuthica TaxID=82996 RepID=UPI0020942674|nr:EAL domain-containing protein [Serratia plymuthica]